MDKNQFQIVNHVYDIEISEIFLRLKEKVKNTSLLLDEIKSEELVERWELTIRNYCELNELDFNLLVSKGSIPISYNQDFYVIAMTLKILTLDVFKLPLFLNYQKALVTNKSEFVGRVEYHVLNSLKNNSPFIDRDLKLEKVIDWIAREKRKQTKDLPVETTFSSLFLMKGFDDELIKILTNHYIVIDGKWEGKTKSKTEINYLIKVLIEKGHLKSDDITLKSKVFCKQFNIVMSARSFRHIPKFSIEILKLYDKIIPRN